MLRYKTETRPGLVTLYDIRPGNGVGPFLQPRSPKGAALHVSLNNASKFVCLVFNGTFSTNRYIVP